MSGNFAMAASDPDPSWATGVADFEIWAGATAGDNASLTWDNGTLVCGATLIDDNATTVICSSGDINASQTYRVQSILLNAIDRTILSFDTTGEYVDHVAVKGSGNWAGTSPTLGTCDFQDIDVNDASPVCSAAWSGDDVRLIRTSGTIEIGDGSIKDASEGFMYLLTTDSDIVDSSASYFDTLIDTWTEDSSRITITAASVFTQSAYRWYENADSLTPGAVLADTNATGTVVAVDADFRLRLLLHNSGGSAEISNEAFKLQYATLSGSCSASTYADVTAATAIAYNNNASVADGDNISTGGTDPTHGGDTIIAQDYEELNNFTNSAAVIANAEDGMWDFALTNNSMAESTLYCLRAVDSAGTVLSAYDYYPAIQYIPSVPVFVSASDQAFEIGQATTTISTITIIAPDASMTATNDIRIAIASTSVAMKWDTTDFTASIGGAESSKMSPTVSYEGDYILVLNLTSDMVSGDTITISGLSFADFASVNTPANGLEMYLGGSYDASPDYINTSYVTIYGSLTTGEHVLGQVSNEWLSQASANAVHYRYSLIPEGEGMTMGETILHLSGIAGVITADITGAKLYVDTRNDGIVNTDSWAMSYDGSIEEFYNIVMDTENFVLYSGQGNTEANIYSCSPKNSGDANGVCETGEWSQAFGQTDTQYELAMGMAYDSVNSVVYAGTGYGTGDGDVLWCQPSTSGDADGFCEDTEWTIGLNNASLEYIYDMYYDASNGVVYAGAGFDAGDGDVYACNPNTSGDADGICEGDAEGTLSTLGASYQAVESLFSDPDNDAMYAGTGASVGDIFVCQPNTSGDADGICEDTEWTLAYDGSSYEEVMSISYDKHNKVIYAGMGWGTNREDILACQPDISGDADGVCEIGEWAIVTQGTQTGVYDVEYNSLSGNLYYAAGANNADGDIYVCNPNLAGDLDGICETGEWTLSYNSAVYNYLFSLFYDEYNHVMYALAGSTAGESDILWMEDSQVGANGVVAISGTTGTVTFATSTNYTIISTTTNFLLELTAANLVENDLMTIDFSSVMATGSLLNISVGATANSSSITHAYSPIGISSAANQTFEINQATTSISAITVSDYLGAQITSANNLRITIATTSVNMRWDTTDFTAGIAGTASGKASPTVSYENNGATLVIAISSNLAADETIIISGLSFVDFNDANASYQGSLQLFTGGVADTIADAMDNKTVTIYGALVSADHSLGQVSDQWDTQTSTTTVHYRYSLVPEGENMIMGTTTFNLTGINGVVSPDITAVTLYEDVNGDGSVGIAGELDDSWATNGVLTWGTTAGTDAVKALAIDANDNIFVGGRWYNSSTEDWMIRKYDSNGDLDTNWGNSGYVTYEDAGSDETPEVIVTDADGSIYAAGGYYNSSDTWWNWMIRKYDSDGNLDTSWGDLDTGIVKYDNADGNSNLLAMAIDSNKNIYVGGKWYTTTYSDSEWHVVKYDPNGDIDTSWGNSGSIIYEKDWNDLIYGIVTDSSGAIYIAGYIYTAANFDDDWYIRKYDSGGVLDTSWGTGDTGIIEIVRNDGSDYIYDIDIDADRNIYVAGQYHNGTDNDWEIRKYDLNGDPASWGTGDTGLIQIANTGTDYAQDVTVASDGSIYVGGHYANSGDDDWMIRKYDPNGDLDASWGSSGIVYYNNTDGGDSVFDMVLDSSESLIAAGYYYNIAFADYDWMLRKYNGSAEIATGYVDISSNIGTITFATTTTYNLSAPTDYLLKMTVSNLVSSIGSPVYFSMEGDIQFEGTNFIEAPIVLPDASTMTIGLGDMDLLGAVSGITIIETGSPSSVTHDARE